jgi:hypothetical protein
MWAASPEVQQLTLGDPVLQRQLDRRTKLEGQEGDLIRIQQQLQVIRCV